MAKKATRKRSGRRAWPADTVAPRAVDGLIPDARNARTHSPEQVAKIAASIEKWGWTQPVLVDVKGTIIAGHGRVLAAAELGLVEIPCMVAKGWTVAQKRAYMIADNQLALSAGWDEDLLGIEIDELDDLGFDLDLLGFDFLPMPDEPTAAAPPPPRPLRLLPPRLQHDPLRPRLRLPLRCRPAPSSTAP